MSKTLGTSKKSRLQMLDEAGFLPIPDNSNTNDTKDSFLSCFKTLDEFTEEEATWIVPGWIPEAQITLMAADGGVGKTTIWCNLLAAFSNGSSCILDPPGHKRQPMKVAFLTTEDSVRKKLKKKLRIAGANEANIIVPDFLASGGSDALRNLKFGSTEISEFIGHFRPAFCVFDPVQGFIPPNINMGSRNAMRDCLAPLITLGEEYGTTFLVVAHTNKRKGAFGRERIADSADLWDVSRSVLIGGYTENKGIRYLSNEKNNYAPLQESLLFSIDSDEQVRREGSTWKRDCDYILGAIAAKPAPKLEDCKEFIINSITDAGGKMLVRELDKLAEVAGHRDRTLRRAKEELEEEHIIVRSSTGVGKGKIWHVSLLKSTSEEQEELPWPVGLPSEI